MKKVEDVMPIATGHEREELEAALQVFIFFYFLFLNINIYEISISITNFIYLIREGTFLKSIIQLAPLVPR